MKNETCTYFCSEDQPTFILDHRLQTIRYEDFVQLYVTFIGRQHIQYLPRGCRVHDPVIVLIGICFIRRLPARLCIHRCPNLVTESRHSSTTVIPCNQLRTIFLYRRWVQHNSNRCAEGLGRKVASELCSYYTGVACEEKSISILRVTLPDIVPCGRVILPQMTLIFDPLTSLCAR
jgi:hypothetical protein